MNKYKKGFTPDEAAMIAVDLSNNDANSNHGINLDKYSSVEEALKGVRKAYSESQLYSFVTNRQGDEILEGRTLTSEKFESVIKLLVDAEEIQKALIAEACIADDFEHNRTGTETILQIYRGCYYNDDLHYFWAEKSELTKESLADWFADIGEKEISNKFRTRKKNVSINPFKQTFIAEHAALIAVGLDEYNSIENAEHCADEQAYSIGEAKREIERGGEADNFEIDEKLDNNLIGKAISLKEALLEEIKLASEYEKYWSSYYELPDEAEYLPPVPCSTDIIIYREEDDHENTIVTKESVAIWLWRSGQNEYARILHSDIENLIKETESYESKMRQQPFNQRQKVNVKDESAKTTRTPEFSLLDSLGIMAWLLSNNSTKFKHSDKPNSSQIMKAIGSVITDLCLNDNTDNKIMISNLNKDIALAIKRLENRFKL